MYDLLTHLHTQDKLLMMNQDPSIRARDLFASTGYY
jgi:hypothetical protein